MAWEKWNGFDVLFKMKVLLVKCVPGYVKLGAPVSKVLLWHFWKHLFKSSEKPRGSKLSLSVKLQCANSASACLLDAVTFSMFLPLRYD